jgi:D-tyrosyl-tRNA(Tyr) deacylase
MITIVQRVIEAKVQVGGEVVGAIGPGLLALTAVVRGDGEKQIAWTAGKLATLRIFRHSEGADAKHFDKDVREIGGSILLVSNFTVCASTRQGRRPSLDRAAEPAIAQALFARLVEAVRAQGVPVETGIFGGDMKVSLTNDGPATFILDSAAL